LIKYFLIRQPHSIPKIILWPAAVEYKPVLSGLPIGDLAKLLSNLPAFRQRQIHKWISSLAGSFDEMTNLPISLRRELKENFSLESGYVSSGQQDADGTVKLGITLNDGLVIEGVILSDMEGRKTACISTQAGCPLGCIFCKTGKLGFRRNLTSLEISDQFLKLKRKDRDISHVVVMGMGEPLLNLDELRKSLDYLMESGGINISKRRITISTSGIEKGILELAEKGPYVRLALSLTTARSELREKLMPSSRENPLPLVKKALLKYQEKTQRRITLEMVLMGGINTFPADAEAAADFAGGLDSLINLIPWNPVAGSEYEGRPLKAPSPKEIREFTSVLENLGLKVTQRYGKGLGISGACGQLGIL